MTNRRIIYGNDPEEGMGEIEAFFFRLWQWWNEDRLMEEREQFEQRCMIDPTRELHVQKVRKMIYQNHDDATAAALKIVDYFLPR